MFTGLISKVLLCCLQRDKPSDFTSLIVLKRNQTNIRNDLETLSNLSKQGKQPMLLVNNGEQLANISLITYRYLEISDETDISHAFKQGLWSSLRQIKDTNRKDHLKK